MRKTSLFIGLAIALVFTATSCDWFDKLLEVDFTTSSTDVSFTVDPTTAGEHVLKVDVIQSDLEQEIEDNGGSLSNLESVEMDEAKAIVLSSGRNLDEFESLTVWASSASVTDIKLAWIDNIPAGSTEIDLSIALDELKDLISEDEYTITVKGVLDQDLTEAIDIKVSLKFHVTVAP